MSEKENIFLSSSEIVIENRGNIFEKELKEIGLEDWLKLFKQVIKIREKYYEDDVLNSSKLEEAKEKKEMLKRHNEIVLKYVIVLIKRLKEHLSEKERAAAILATILHDSKKIGVDILKHHEESAQRAENILMDFDNKFDNKEDINVSINDDFRQLVKQAILRHNNHPFLVALNQGQRFPEPETNVDKLVFDADMLANVGFKNVGFRLVSEKFRREDQAQAASKGITPIQEAFANVMAGVEKLKEVVLTAAAKQLVTELVKIVEDIFQNMIERGVFTNMQAISLELTPEQVRQRLNQEIIASAKLLNIEEDLYSNFLI